ncbi:hypothetical protein LOD99_1257 [Oopsacas minuta]|uniref:Uncharacterized protein n=1 Tax=Oopsacas minuta TaxID=111878 RepID=A0AAV7K662_9METZ|nr:hypothetical protein LOD99_1257 [Oopsacas minuta]
MLGANTQSILKPIQNYGIGSARYCSGFDAGLISKNKHCFDMPSGMFVVRWDINKKTQIFKKQLHNSLIGCHIINKSHTMCLTVAFGGGLSLWDTNYNLLDTVQLSYCMDIRCAAWRRDGAQVCIAGVGYGSAVLCYDVMNSKLKLSWRTCPPGKL